MSTWNRLATGAILATCVLALLALAAGSAAAQEPGPAGAIDEAALPQEGAAVASVLPIQGRLTDESGVPLNGTYTVHASLYPSSGISTPLCTDTDGVAVNQGLFEMSINGCSSSVLDGKQLFLGIAVGSDMEMTPRQPIYAVPYAWSLRPGAIISGSTSSAIVHIENWDPSARGLRAYAMSESGTNYGVVGASRSPDGYGGYFYNNAGGDGVRGEGWFGVYGEGTSAGMRGQSTNGYGVYGLGSNGIGVGGATLATNHNYGFYTTDNLYSLNIHLLGAEMQVVQNGGETLLESGDVVAFSGMGAPLEAGGQPVIQVESVDAANSTAVAGVVYSRYNVAALAATAEALPAAITPEGAAAPGDFLLVVVRGPVQVKASALAGALAAGDLVSSAGITGFAAKSAEVTASGVPSTLPGTVLGKALEPLAGGEARIYIYVTLQ